MKQLKNIFILPFLVLLLLSSNSNAQEIDENGYNYNSIRPVRRADIMYLNTIWLRMDVREKMNEPFFAINNEITKIIIDAVKAGVLRPYKNDSLTTRMPNKEFLDNLKKPGAGDGGEDVFGGGSGGGDDWGGGGGFGGGGGWGSESGGGAAKVDQGPEEFFAKDITFIEIKEDLLFDKKRSRMFHDIQSIKLIIPGDKLPTGIDKDLAVFSYKELVQNVFLDNSQAIWYNPKNTAETRNLSEAFDLRLFAARIVKFSNPKDYMIEDIYSGNQKLGLAKSQEYEHQLLEYESNLWSN